MTKIAFIGLGAMGHRMARRLAATDEIELSVYDLVQERMEEFRGSARLAESVADATAGADGIFCVVPADRHVRAVADELATVGEPGQFFVEFSTIGPSTIEAVAEQLSARGVETIAAGMTKSIEGATNGTLSLFIGGVDEMPEALRPAIDALATELMIVGSSGAGKALKLVNNMVVASLDMAINDALTLGQQYGLEMSEVTDALCEQGADSWALRNHIIPHVLPDDLGPGFFSTRFLIKDLRLYTEFVTERRLPAIFAGLNSAYLRGTAAHGFGDDYHMITVRWLERGAKVGEREATALAEGETPASLLSALTGAVRVVQALVSAEAIEVLGRMGVSPGDSANYLETGSAGNDSLSALGQSLAGVGEDFTYAEMLSTVETALTFAAAAEVPAASFEVARHTVLGLMDRYGEANEIWRLSKASATS